MPSTLWENLPGKARYDAPATSIEAAKAITPTTGSMRHSVFCAIQKAAHRGMTDEEIQDTLAMSPSTERPRRGELVKYGLVVDSGRTRRTHSGRRATVWIDATQMKG